MIINFKFSNVYSFKDKNEFSFVRGLDISNLERIKRLNDFDLLKFSIVYGANSYGKTNLLKALVLMKDIIINGKLNSYNDYSYKLDSNNKESNFIITLLINNKIYNYGFIVNFKLNKITDEWLYVYQNKEFVLIYDRKLNNDISISNSLNKDIIEKIKFYYEDIKNNSNILLLTYLNKDKPSLYELNDFNIFKDIFNFFKYKIVYLNDNNILYYGNNSDIKIYLSNLERMIKYFDFGIDNLKLKEVNTTNVIKEIGKLNYQNILNNAFDIMNIKNINELSLLYKNINNLYKLDISKDNKINCSKVYFSKFDILFNLYEEGKGLSELINYSKILLDKENQFYLIDNYGNYFHNNLINEFSNLLLNNITKYDKQIIMTSNNLNMFEGNLLRRDEVWFVEKTNNESNLISLIEYKENFKGRECRAYLDGRYVGIPKFKDIIK